MQEVLSDDIMDMIVSSTGPDEIDMHLSLNAIDGTDKANTLRFRAMVKNQVMIVLMDSGSSHSFLDQSLADRLGCCQTPIQPRIVKVANGDTIPCTSEIKDFIWWVPNSTFHHDMKVLKLGGYDAILRMDWLEKRGLMNCEFAQKWVEFKYEGAIV